MAEGVAQAAAGAARRVKLGSLNVSKVCLGTMTFGSMSNQDTAFEILDRFIELGGNFIDTAEMYPVPVKAEYAGESEYIIGRWLKARAGRIKRDEIVIASKVSGPRAAAGPFVVANRARALGHPAGDGNVAADFSPGQLRQSCEASLARLGIECLDLFQLHWPERHVPKWGAGQYVKEEEEADEGRDLQGFDSVVSTIGALIAEGKVKEWGISNETSYGVAQACEAAKRNGVRPPVSIQNDFSLCYRIFESELAESCSTKHYNIGLIAYGVLNGGALSGKYLRGGATASSRFNFCSGFQPRYHSDRANAAIAEYMALADKHGMTLAALAQAWAFSRFYLSCVIIGATSTAQLEENCKSAYVDLSPEILAEIDQIHVRHRNPNLEN
uniref:NADP-dependent oxidoreductase domain-containing protein n=1 Tax=Chrysotila carterae TaxID=13221 RepID=A0A7S4BWG5_CHRCT